MEAFAAIFIFVLGIVAWAQFGSFILKKLNRGGESAGEKSAWLTRNQLEVLQEIADTGREGVHLWEFGLPLSTIRSLAKRGYLDTKAGWLVIATGLGRRRLSQPWPEAAADADGKAGGAVTAKGSGELAPVASEGVSGDGEI